MGMLLARRRLETKPEVKSEKPEVKEESAPKKRATKTQK